MKKNREAAVKERDFENIQKMEGYLSRACVLRDIAESIVYEMDEINPNLFSVPIRKQARSALGQINELIEGMASEQNRTSRESLVWTRDEAEGMECEGKDMECEAEDMEGKLPAAARRTKIEGIKFETQLDPFSLFEILEKLQRNED